jgi:hypothetical protein
VSEVLHPPKSNPEFELEKVTLSLEEGAWHGYATESVWAVAADSGHYRIQNVPFYAREISYDDVVAVRRENGQAIAIRVTSRAGHSTYRLFLVEGLSVERFENAWKPLARHGCTYERATNRLVAVDVPPSANIHEVYSLLEKGERAGLWDFQEGHCGHTVGTGEPS